MRRDFAQKALRYRTATFSLLGALGLPLVILASPTAHGAEPAIAATVAVAEARDTSNFLFRATEALKSDNVLSYDSTPIGLEDKLRAAMKGTTIGVVALPLGMAIAKG